MEKRSSWKDFKSYLFWIVGAVLLAVVIRIYVMEKVVVQGASMLPTFESGQQLFIEKVTYRLHDPKRFDVIVLKAPPGEEHEFFIKRIIGLPGETIQIKEGFVYINGTQLEDPYGEEPTSVYGIAELEIKLGENEYFVLGDNRDGSRDSRAIGPINRSDIKGRVFLRIWPFDSIKTF